MEPNNSLSSEGEEYFTNSEGQKICYKWWKPALSDNKNINTAVFILHGVGEHFRAYETVIQGLVKRGWLVCAHDHVGHGKSDGDRVHIKSISRYSADVVQHVELVKKSYPDVTCFAIGHSMGGAITLKTALDNPKLFAGLILIGPAVTPDKATATPFKVFLAKAVAGILPQCEVGPVQPDWLSRDKSVGEDYAKDPLNWHGGLKAKWAVCMLHCMEEIMKRVNEMTWPFFILHGTHDKLCALEGSQQLYDKAPSKDKKLKVFPGAYHQVHKEVDGQAEEAINDMCDWIAHLTK